MGWTTTRKPTAKARLRTERLWHFRLCDEHFPGLSVDEMLARLSALELTDWITYYQMKDKAQKDAEAKKR